MIKPKIGFAVLAAPTHTTVKDEMGGMFVREDIVDKAFESLHSEDISIVRHKGFVLTRKDAEKMIKEFEEEEVDAVLLYITTWVWAAEFVQALRSTKIPLILWGEPISRGWPTVGLFVTHGALSEVGMEHKMIYAKANDNSTIEELRATIRAAAVTRKLGKSRYGMIGGRSMGMLSSTIDPNQWMSQFGIDVKNIDQYSLVLKAEKASRGEVEKIYRKLKSELGNIPELDIVTEKSIRVYLGYKEIIEENDLDFAAVKCIFDLSNNYCSACLAVSMFQNEGVPAGCEGDQNGALLTYMFRLLSDVPVFSADIQQILVKERILTMVNDGAASFDLAEEKKDIKLNRQWGGESAQGGICVSLTCKPGKVTLARLHRVKGEYRMLIVRGEVFDRGEEAKKNTGFPSWPHAFIRFSGDGDKLVQNCYSQYIHICYDDIVSELLEICRILKIEPVLIEPV